MPTFSNPFLQVLGQEVPPGATGRKILGQMQASTFLVSRELFSSAESSSIWPQTSSCSSLLLQDRTKGTVNPKSSSSKFIKTTRDHSGHQKATGLRAQAQLGAQACVSCRILLQQRPGLAILSLPKEALITGATPSSK